MIYEILQIILWITVVLLAVSGLDDLYLDLLYWFLRRRHKSKFPDFSQMHDKIEKPIAIMMGAWNESGVIGRTLSYAIGNIKYKNYRIFVGLYPNDAESIRVVKEVAARDSRIKICINPQEGPTTKADNLNSLYAAITEFEKAYGEFEIIIVHDAEDFIHPYSMKLYNFLIGYKGYHGIQIPVVPIKSKFGKTYHRTSCDAFAEIHTKDMIVRQGMGAFIPYSGTGMGFHRRAIYHLEKYCEMKKKNIKMTADKYIYKDPFGNKVEMNDEYFRNTESETKTRMPENRTNYHDDPFTGLNIRKTNYRISTKALVRRFTVAFVIIILSLAGYLIYIGTVNNNGIAPVISNSILYQNAFGSDRKDTEQPNLGINEPNNSGNSADTGKESDSALFVSIDKGKIGLLESEWDTEEEAGNHLSEITGYPALKDLNVIVQKFNNGNAEKYRVILGKYDNIEDIQKDIRKLRKAL
ncbi:MAG: glycosyltransferase [Bacteroidetes bacterium]|nr:glycosyltransferase [Bacteroidota bacterium]